MSSELKIRRQAAEPKRFAAVGLTTPEGRPLMLFVEARHGTSCTDDLRISLWADIQERDVGSGWDEDLWNAEYAAYRAEESDLEGKLDAVADNVLETFGNGDYSARKAIADDFLKATGQTVRVEDVLAWKALAEGLSIVTGREVAIDEVFTALVADSPRYVADKEKFDKAICEAAYNEQLENEARGYGLH